jgi:hypothetical protein
LDIQKDIQMVKQNVWLLKRGMLYLSIIKVMDKVRVSLVIQSMLSDAMVEVHHPELMEEGQERLRFVKYLVHHYPNTNQDIMVDFVYEQFKQFGK